VSSLGARLFHLPWTDDFSAARNYSIDNARGKWVFWMDSDDTIPPSCGEKLQQLARSPHRENVLGYVMQVRCPGSTSSGLEEFTVVDHVKLFRNRPELRFEGPIHEQVMMPIRRLGGEIHWTDIYVVHSGSDQSPESNKRKIDGTCVSCERTLRAGPIIHLSCSILR
jgi:glycosyltransferase involved in cell wall biosynthesis